MKNKGVRQSHVSLQNSEAIDVWNVAADHQVGVRWRAMIIISFLL